MRLVVLLALWTFASVNARTFENVPEAYSYYVDQVSPVTHKIAENDAYLREFALYAEEASLLQKRLVEVGSFVQEAMSLLPKSRVAQGQGCPTRAAGGFDPVATMEELRWSQRLRNVAIRASETMADYRKARPQIASLCSNEKRFLKYEVGNLGFEFARVKRAWGEDRFFFVLAFDGNGGIDPNGPLRSGLGVLSAKWSIAEDKSVGGALETLANVFTFGAYDGFKNAAHMGQVRDQYRRLSREMVQESGYQAKARAACGAIQEKHQPALLELDRVAAFYTRWIADLPMDLLRQREAFFRACFVQHEKEFLDFLKAKTAVAALRPETARLTIELNGRLNRNRMLLEKSECGQGEGYRQQLRTGLAMARVWKLSTLNEVAPRAEAALMAYQAKCGGVQ